MNRAREISIFQEYHTTFWDQYTSKKADPKTFAFWVNGIFAKKCGLMQYQKSSYQSQ